MPFPRSGFQTHSRDFPPPRPRPPKTQKRKENRTRKKAARHSSMKTLQTSIYKRSVSRVQEVIVCVCVCVHFKSQGRTHTHKRPISPSSSTPQRWLEIPCRSGRRLRFPLLRLSILQAQVPRPSEGGEIRGRRSCAFSSGDAAPSTLWRYRFPAACWLVCCAY